MSDAVLIGSTEWSKLNISAALAAWLDRALSSERLLHAETATRRSPAHRLPVLATNNEGICADERRCNGGARSRQSADFRDEAKRFAVMLASWWR
jgi:hypothetical protein